MRVKAFIDTFCITVSNKHENKISVPCHRILERVIFTNVYTIFRKVIKISVPCHRILERVIFTNVYTIFRKVIKTILFDWIQSFVTGCIGLSFSRHVKNMIL